MEYEIRFSTFDYGSPVRTVHTDNAHIHEVVASIKDEFAAKEDCAFDFYVQEWESGRMLMAPGWSPSST